MLQRFTTVSTRSEATDANCTLSARPLREGGHLLQQEQMRITLLAATLAAARPRPTALRAALRRRGGDVVETAAASCRLSPGRAEELASLNEREHAAECIKVEGEAWSGALEPDTDIPQTDKFAIPDWYWAGRSRQRAIFFV